MNNFVGFLRYAMLLAVMMIWMPANAQNPFTLTTPDDVTNHTEKLYWLESNGATGFYAIPHTDDSLVSTTNMPNLNALWYFMDAGSESETQYYYIVNHNTGYYLKLKGTPGQDKTIIITNFGSGGDDFKFSVTGSDGQWVFHPKNGSDYYVNKRAGNVSYDKYLKASSSTDANSKWNVVARNSVTWAHPFTNSTNEVKHYYKIHNATSNGSAFYISTDDASDPYATVSNVNNKKRVWYFIEADSDNTIPNLKYYYIVNAKTGKYLKFTKTANGSSQASSLQLYEHTGTETGETENRFQFMVLNATGKTYSAYSIMPKVEISYYDNKNASLSPSYNYNTSLSNDMKIGIYNDRGKDDNYAHWLIEATDFVLVAAPTITNNDGTITLSTTTPNATIYYTTNGDTPDNNSTEYEDEPFALGDATVIKAIAYLDSDYSDVSVYNIHDYSQNYLTFRILTGGTICWKAFGSDYIRTIEYSKNNGSWTSITSTSEGATFEVSANDVVRFRGSNNTYAGSKADYSGFEGGTATFDIEGNIHSLLYEDDFADYNALTNSTYQFCSLFKKARVISAENLILPATTLKNYCYRALFSWCTTLEKAPALPATTLANGCYWYMFEKCAITTAPDLNATTLVSECYGHMFCNCSTLDSINCLATTGFNQSKCLEGWTEGVAATGTFVKDADATNWTTGTSGIPTDWTIYEVPNIPTISSDGREIELSCATTSADIYYKLNHSGSFTQYTTAIQMNGDTFIECYSEKDGQTSATVSQTCVYDDRTIFEYSNQSLDSWTYNGNTITTPYSVNAIDGHSSSYAKGTFNFETDVNLHSPQPTYLWFQHADQSASIYVDNNLVEKHWGGYNAFFVDISSFVHKGTNNIKVALKNNEGNVLAPYAGDFNFNATLGNVRLFTSPYLPSMSYGYDGFHITSTVSSAEATINVKTTIPTGASVVCTITDGDTQVFTDTLSSTGNEMVFTTTITNPHLWNGTIDPHLYNVKLEIYHDNELYHRYERPYGLRFYEYVFDQTVNGNSYTGFLLNGQPYLLRGVCVHDDLANKANALNDDDYTQEFNIITELGCNFLRLAHYPHPKEVYDKCDQLGIVVQTEAPWVNKSTTGETEAYWAHLEGQCADMVNQHYNHPCIIFWGVGNEINSSFTTTTEGKDFVKGKIEDYRDTIRSLMPNAWVGYTVSHGTQDGLGIFNNPTVDWIGQNIYVGWYIDKTSNNPTYRLTTAINNATTQNTPCAYSEYGCGGTPSCHSDDFMTTTTTGNNPRHDIEYQMWLHEGHIAAIKNFPQLLFTSQWQLFDIAVSNRTEGYKVCKDGESASVFDNDELKRLNNKGLVERDHKTKKDPFYLYKAWWNTSDKFVHICGKDYKKTTSRVIKCYTNDGSSLKLFVNNVEIETATVANNIATFEARNFNPGDVIRVTGDNSDDTFTITNYNVFTTEGDWDEASNWSTNAVPATGCDVDIVADATVPSDYTANAGNVTLYGSSTLTIADGGQLYHNNEGVTATVQKSIAKYTAAQNPEDTETDRWHMIGSPATESFAPSADNGFLTNEYDLYYYHEPTQYWRNYKSGANNADPGFNIETLKGYLYANTQDVTLVFEGNLRAGNATVNVPLSYTSDAGSAKGFNLVGNPFAHNVTSYTGARIASECYRMNSTNTDLIVDDISDSNPLKTGEGFFVKATAENASITFNSDAKDRVTKTGRINIEIRKNNRIIDRLIVKSEGEPLEKLTLQKNSTRIFAMHDNKKMAVVPIDGNEQDIYFETAKNGTYTLTVSETLNSKLSTLNFKYLHLIDNQTGTDVDLLQTPSYSFKAKTMDDADRFKLVFVCGDVSNDNKTFAFISNGNIIITADVEGATLQVVDVMGRVIVSREGDVSGSVSTNGMASGTYILRLINGNNVMTQKIVIR